MGTDGQVTDCRRSSRGGGEIPRSAVPSDEGYQHPWNLVGGDVCYSLCIYTAVAQTDEPRDCMFNSDIPRSEVIKDPGDGSGTDQRPNLRSFFSRRSLNERQKRVD